MKTNMNDSKLQITHNWTQHHYATVPGITTRQEVEDYKLCGGHGPILCLITVAGDGMTPVKALFRGWCQRQAEQVALAWTRCRWVRDARALWIGNTDIVG